MSHTIERQWKTKHGHHAIVLMTEMGHRCGYVAVEPGHLLHGKGYDDAKIDDEYPNVHGGLTYAAPCTGSVCHDGPEDLWWFGFDAAHLGDSPDPDCEYQKKMHAVLGYESILMQGIHRTQEYMEKECESLSEQFARARAPIDAVATTVSVGRKSELRAITGEDPV